MFFSAIMLAASVQAGFCAIQPANGTYLDGPFPAGDFMPSLEVMNGTGSFAVARLQKVDAPTSVTVFVGRGQSVTVPNVPPGVYELRFAHGGKFLPDCTTLAEADGVSQFADPLVFEVRETQTPVPGGTEIEMEASFNRVTLYGVKNGNARTSKISIKDFNKQPPG